jgi:AraC-like DNA-binding protein
VHLLEHSMLSVKEISAALGYTHPSNFSRHCRQILRLTPRNGAEPPHATARLDQSSFLEKHQRLPLNGRKRWPLRNRCHSLRPTWWRKSCPSGVRYSKS